MTSTAATGDNVGAPTDDADICEMLGRDGTVGLTYVSSSSSTVWFRRRIRVKLFTPSTGNAPGLGPPLVRRVEDNDDEEELVAAPVPVEIRSDDLVGTDRTGERGGLIRAEATAEGVSEEATVATAADVDAVFSVAAAVVAGSDDDTLSPIRNTPELWLGSNMGAGGASNDDCSNTLFWFSVGNGGRCCCDDGGGGEVRGGLKHRSPAAFRWALVSFCCRGRRRWGLNVVVSEWVAVAVDIIATVGLNDLVRRSSLLLLWLIRSFLVIMGLLDRVRRSLGLLLAMPSLVLLLLVLLSLL